MKPARDNATRPLRLLQVLEPSGGGSGRHFLDLCRGLKQRGHVVHAVYSPRRAEERFVGELLSIGLDGAHALDMARSPGPSDIASYIGLRGVMRKLGPFDAIHAHSSKAGALSRLRLPGPHVPRIYTPHAFRTMDPHLGATGAFVYGFIERFLARFFTDELICVSADEYAHARALGIPRKRLSIIVNGVDEPAHGLRDAIREELAIPPHALVFGFVGRLSAQKAPERLIEAFTIAAQTLPDAYLLMVGTGELEQMVGYKIDSSTARDRIRLTTRYTGRQVMDAIDILTMPSRYEAMSYVMLEAAAAARPLVLTQVGGASTVLKDSRNGVLVENVDDPRPFAKAMIKAASPARFERFRAEALRRSGDYGLPRMIADTEAIYRRLAR
ncbi:glycosyltransferase involved in cell wall bisynthesis [Rhizobium subbaraonis]|uniref:Glycosyltransferase involved in cell wall bisynthesis n=1 Tax=Rhizobium subbaraonis TaxID=908946 RepID=A0A285UCH4_9HYPH|nr:glycosyltransferase [Rhizobium subbaraonis]SOC39600.1 glycosyltransferase involved in cell wall bisynthesis [Rhizobium subbaraonis]